MLKNRYRNLFSYFCVFLVGVVGGDFLCYLKKIFFFHLFIYFVYLFIIIFYLLFFSFHIQTSPHCRLLLLSIQFYSITFRQSWLLDACNKKEGGFFFFSFDKKAFPEFIFLSNFGARSLSFLDFSFFSVFFSYFFFLF